MKKYSYAASLIAVFLLPALYIWSVLEIQIPVAQMFIFIGLITVVGSFYDVWAAKHGEHDTHWLWTFNKSNTIGVQILDLPLEEYLFYTCSALYVVIAWEGVKIGYMLTSYFHLGVLVGAALWTIVCVLGSFKIVGYDK